MFIIKSIALGQTRYLDFFYEQGIKKVPYWSPPLFSCHKFTTLEAAKNFLETHESFNQPLDVDGVKYPPALITEALGQEALNNGRTVTVSIERIEPVPEITRFFSGGSGA